MRKLVLTCGCGEQIQVPAAVMGKRGLCPLCGRKVHITEDNTVELSDTIELLFPVDPPATDLPADALGPDEDGCLFGRAVDLYGAGRRGEAMALFETLAKRHPEDPEVQRSRELCLKAVHDRRPTRENRDF